MTGQNKAFVVIMAGGIGSRFWPLSRKNKPKQFLDLLGIGKSLLQITFERFRQQFADNEILVVTSERYLDDIQSQLPSLPADNILAEPLRKNTAPAILYAAKFLQDQYGQVDMIVSPADHFILEQNVFNDTINDGLNYLQTDKEALLTLGITPTKPHTGYGYIQFEESDQPIKRVKTFTEKPTREFAQRFIDSGDFLWNSGIFLWNTNTIIKAFKEYLPDIYSAFEQINFKQPVSEQTLQHVFSTCSNISIDYGILEKSSHVLVIPSHFSWSDLGTWDSIYDFMPKDENENVIQAHFSIVRNSHGNMVHIANGEKLIAMQGIEDCIIVDTEDTLLVCKLNSEDKIREIVHSLQNKHLEEFL